MYILSSRPFSSRKRTPLAAVLLVAALGFIFHVPMLTSAHTEGTGTPVAISCNAPEMGPDEYADAISSRPDDSQRSYKAAGTAPTSDATAAVDTMNHYAACRQSGEYRQARSLNTHYGLYWSHTNAHNIEEWNDHQQARIDAGFSLSPAFDSAAAIVVQDGNDATPAGSTYTTEFSAENAILLEDGRVAILHTVVLPGGSQLADEPLIAEMGSVTILMNVDGAWLIDETLPLCFENCDVNRAMLESVLLIVPASTPAATPASD